MGKSWPTTMRVYECWNPRMPRLPRKSHIHRGWDFSKWPLVIGAFLTLAQQTVTLQGSLRKQREDDAATMVAMRQDLNRTMTRVFGNHDPRLVKLEERKARRNLDQGVHVTRADSANRSPGLLHQVARVPART